MLTCCQRRLAGEQGRWKLLLGREGCLQRPYNGEGSSHEVALCTRHLLQGRPAMVQVRRHECRETAPRFGRHRQAAAAGTIIIVRRRRLEARVAVLAGFGVLAARLLIRRRAAAAIRVCTATLRNLRAAAHTRMRS